MGWTHDYRDAARDRSGNGAASRTQLGSANLSGGGPGAGAVHRLQGGALEEAHIGFPDILRRRARWVGSRLRHPRS
jgi:hypothetical protein